MIILHGTVYERELYLWGESPPEGDPAAGRRPSGKRAHAAEPLPFGARLETLENVLADVGMPLEPSTGEEPEMFIWMPAVGGAPVPSSPLVSDPPKGEKVDGLLPWNVATIPLDVPEAVEFLCICAGRTILAPVVIVGGDLSYLVNVMRFAAALVAREQFLPGVERVGRTYFARWEPIFLGSDADRLARLARAMPSACRALSERKDSPPAVPPAALLFSFMGNMVDHLARSAAADRIRRIRPKSGKQKPVFDSIHDRWVYALSSPDGIMEETESELARFASQVMDWDRPVTASTATPFKLCFRLEEPRPEEEDTPRAGRSLLPGSESDVWSVQYFLQASDDPSLLVPAKHGWKPTGRGASILRRDNFNARQYLLSALGQASGLCPSIEASLKTSAPEGYLLNTQGAFQFLTERAWALEQAGFGVLLPAWWTRKGTKLRLGACLADDMGLGKTIQTLALVREESAVNGSRPVLLICPMSVVSNWQKEAARFTPDLSVMIHHGAARSKGKRFKSEAKKQDIVVSSYSLLHRDFETLKTVEWAGIILDEAQNIKNPETKQAKAARALQADYRIALTGTPVENNVGDLWSIMEFLNPGFLGSQSEFRRSFFIPIQANRDVEAAERLKRMTGPFILRRLKTDKSIIADLPEKMEMKVFCPLTKEQASLYEAVVKDVADTLDATEGIQRKGIVLATLSKLKQVCNHPAQFLGDNSPIPGRSGKLARLTEMLEEILEVGERALIFSQFTEMGEIIRRHIQESFGREVLFLHGGIAKKQRDRMVERFQQEESGPSVFLLSLKAGGTGLNLTRANHVFHFDRWWNPAVENQATDRAFRIGQVKNVQVHKFICAGTLEERIDEMIERKREVSEGVVGAGEAWLTELSTDELKALFALDKEAVAD